MAHLANEWTVVDGLGSLLNIFFHVLIADDISFQMVQSTHPILIFYISHAKAQHEMTAL